MIEPLFQPHQLVRLLISIPKRRGRTRVTLEAGRQFEVTEVTEYATSPEYTLRDPQTKDIYANVPEHCLERVTETRPAAVFGV